MPSLAELAAGLKRRAGVTPPTHAALPACVFIVETMRLGDATGVTGAIARLPRGSAVILRDYADGDRRARAADLASLCRRRRMRLLVGCARSGDARLAVAVGAGGVHLPEGAIAHGAGHWRRWRKCGWLVTAAAHTPAAVARARRSGVDAVLLSPVFATASHPGAGTVGPLRFAAWTRAAGLPVYALGGMTAITARRVAASGAIGIAAIGGFAVA